jgi:hypothetical protein
VSTVDQIYEKTKSLPDRLQSEALRYVEYLVRRRAPDAEVSEWRRLLRETQSCSAAQNINEDDIAAEIAAYRNGK